MTSCPDANKHVRPRRILSGVGVTAGFVLFLALWTGGCGRQQQPSPEASQSQQASHSKTMSDELMHHALDAMYRLEEFEGAEMLQRTIDRLDQWMHEQKPLADWKPDAMIGSLPKPLGELPVVKELGKLDFTHADGLALQEAIWLRDASNWAKGTDVDDLSRAKNLFDWTVRNIQVEPDGGSSTAERVIQTPWETILLGKGSVWERAWVFLLMARQQGLDVFVLGLPAKGDTSGVKVEPWALALWTRDQLYVFDPALGLPIPGPGGIQLNEQGELDIKPATLAQLAADEGLLKQLQVDGEHPYPVTSGQLAGAVALLEASPAYLEQKMALLESRLVGSERIVLSSSPSVEAARLKAAKQIKDVRLWTFPYEQAAQRQRLGEKGVRWQQFTMLPFQAGQGGVLWKGRLLHLKGVFTGDENATMYYQMARPSDRELAASQLPPQIQAVYLLAKMDASYWLGLIAQAQGNYRSAIDYLSNRTLLLAVENGPWNHGARYNLGRIYEAQHNYTRALETYRLKSSSPTRHGNLLRAKWLESVAMGKETGKESSTPEAKPTEKPSEATPALPALPTLPSLPEEKPKESK